MSVMISDLALNVGAPVAANGRNQIGKEAHIAAAGLDMIEIRTIAGRVIEGVEVGRRMNHGDSFWWVQQDLFYKDVLKLR